MMEVLEEYSALDRNMSRDQMMESLMMMMKMRYFE